MTMCNGKIIYQDGELIGIDEKALAEKGEEVCSRVLRKDSEAFRGFVF